MITWSMHFERGVGLLARHRPREAAESFEHALSGCPAGRPAELHRICFYLGISLRRLGYAQAAVRALLSCQQLQKRGYARRMLARMVNGYGMARRACQADDDWYAFLAIQLSRYLATRHKRAFSTHAERDMVSDLLHDYWHALERTGALRGRDCGEKQRLFERMRIVFPTVVLSDHEPATAIPVNFRTQRKVGTEERCFCGSGLPFSKCCGRTRGIMEIIHEPQ
jgi:hypothetical protein